MTRHKRLIMVWFECVGVPSFICMEKDSSSVKMRQWEIWKTKEFGWQRRCCASSAYLVIAYLDVPSFFGKRYYPLSQIHALTKLCCVCQIACLSDSSVRFIDLISSYCIQLSQQGHLGLLKRSSWPLGSNSPLELWALSKPVCSKRRAVEVWVCED